MTRPALRLTRKDFPGVHEEINRLRKRDGLEPVGSLGFAHKLVSHFHISSNPRVEEALRNYERRLCCATP